jgi:steroid 5-alpha reductase family enzyme
MSKTTRDNGVILATYIVAVAIGLSVAVSTWNTMPRWAAVLAGDVAATLSIFVASRIFDNSSVYDAYWSVAPPVIAVGLMLTTDAGSTARGWLVIALVGAWGCRLTYNWWRGWTGLGHEDWRYVDLRNSTGRAYWLVSLFGLHLFPTALVYVGCLSLLPIMDTTARPLGWIDAIAAALMAGATYIEATADRQLHDFVKSKPPPEAVMTKGLWGRCRHPNYLGELMLWYGLAAFGLAANPSAWWVVAGPAVMTALFLFISIPMIEKRMLRKRPAYAEVVKRYPVLLPLGPR